MPIESSHSRAMKSKSLFGSAVAMMALVVVAPLLLVVGFAIRVTMGSPILFRQVRAGLNSRPFRLIKFRSMKGGGTSVISSTDDERRLTGLGRFLRATSIDELPSLWNVVRGEMTLVGPRPLLMEYLPLYSDTQAKRHEALPGLTGWAQVNGRNAISWEEKFNFDVWYVENRTPLIDAKILLMTIKTVFSRRGISQSGHATMPPFGGSHPVADEVN
ncbi:MAG: sugar transferase EpsL [Rhodothermales bacterium]|jgi:sugar transferase EpsL